MAPLRGLEESVRNLVRLVLQMGGNPFPPDSGALDGYAVVHCYQGNPIHVAFRRDWLRGQRLRTDSLTLIWMQDDSMQPTLRPGDSVLIDRAIRAAGTCSG